MNIAFQGLNQHFLYFGLDVQVLYQQFYFGFVKAIRVNYLLQQVESLEKFIV